MGKRAWAVLTALGGASCGAHAEVESPPAAEPIPLTARVEWREPPAPPPKKPIDPRRALALRALYGVNFDVCANAPAKVLVTCRALPEGRFETVAVDFVDDRMVDPTCFRTKLDAVTFDAFEGPSFTVRREVPLHGWGLRGED